MSKKRKKYPKLPNSFGSIQLCLSVMLNMFKDKAPGVNSPGKII